MKKIDKVMCELNEFKTIPLKHNGRGVFLHVEHCTPESIMFYM